LANQRKFYRFFRHSSKGFSLIEVLVALAILGLVAAAFLGGLATANKAMFIADKRTTAESLARTEMEYVKNQNYSTALWDYELPSSPPSWDLGHNLPEGYYGYTVSVDAVPLHATDDGIQKITVTVSLDTSVVIELVDYKVNR